MSAVVVWAVQDELRRALAAALRGSCDVVELRGNPTAETLSGLSPPPDALVFGWVRLGVEVEATIRLARRTFPSVAVIAAVTTFTPPAVTAAFGAGLGGLVRTEEIRDCLPLAVEAAKHGHVVAPDDAWAAAAAPALSVREKQTLALVVMGFSNAEIARKLYVTESTVKSHLSSAFARLGVKTRREATALILDPERGFGTGILAISEEERRGRRTSTAER